MQSVLQSAVLSVSLGLLIAFPSLGSTQQISAKLLGGQYAPQVAGRRVAFITTLATSCTGTLVGRNLVLTAAHCVNEESDPAAYQVFVGGSSPTVVSVSYHSGFDPSLPIVEARPFDIGMLVLAENITESKPIPILVGRKLRSSQRLVVAGYGYSEKGSETMDGYEEFFKVGEIKIDKVDGSMLYSSHQASKTSLCSGDSGGPAVEFYAEHLALVGVASTGTNAVRDSKCILRYGGESAHVNLQSSSSLQFLAQFEGVEYATWGNMVVANTVIAIKAQLAKTSRSRSMSQLQKSIAQNLRDLRGIRARGTNDREVLIGEAISLLVRAQSAASLTNAKRLTKSAWQTVSHIAAKGIT